VRRAARRRDAANKRDRKREEAGMPQQPSSLHMTLNEEKQALGTARRRDSVLGVAMWRPGLVGLVVGLVALALLGPGAGGDKTVAPDLAAYSGVGTWIDIYSSSSRADPDRLVSGLAGYGVRTLFVQTGNFRQHVDLVGPRRLGELLDSAHSRSIAVVAWYLPALTNPARDFRRASAAIEFRSSRGERFDSFALDIESTAVRNSAERSRRLLELSTRLRAAVGPGRSLGAVIPSPVGMKLLPRYWPGFPYVGLARIYDVFLPMAYFSYRAHGGTAVSRYVQTSVRIIRQESGNPDVPIHVIGGLADAADQPETAAFAQTVASCGVLGLSLYDLDGTKRQAWSLLGRAAAVTRPATRC
jgi:hypothetical protein